jgi:phage shock protein A
MTKQTITGRASQLARANVEALLDQAEDPQKTADQLIRDYTATIREAEEAVAGSMGNLRLTEQDRAQDVAAAAEWGGKAAAASRRADELRAAGGTAEADRFDHLAKVALGRQLLSEREARAAAPVIAAHTEQAAALKAGLDGMKDRLRRLQDRRDELVARSRTAPARQAMMDTVKSVDLFDPAGDLGRFEDKVRREEARANGRQELAASTLDAQFEALDPVPDPAEVEARLAGLKSRTA